MSERSDMEANNDTRNDHAKVSAEVPTDDAPVTEQASDAARAEDQGARGSQNTCHQKREEYAHERAKRHGSE